MFFIQGPQVWKAAGSTAAVHGKDRSMHALTLAKKRKIYPAIFDVFECLEMRARDTSTHLLSDALDGVSSSQSSLTPAFLITAPSSAFSVFK